MIAGHAMADTVTLKSGEVVEGKIRYATDQAVSIEVQFSPTIRDERIIPASEVESIQRLSPDGIEFQRLSKIRIPATALDPSPYDRILKEDLRPFLERYSFSDHADAVEKMVAEFEKERSRIADGGQVKADGVWLTPDEFKAEKYQIEASALLERLKREFDLQRWPETLNLFEVLKKSYPNSIAFVEALPMASTAADRFDAKLNFDLRNLPAVLRQRQSAVERASERDADRIRRAFEEEEAGAKRISEQARARQESFHAAFSFDEALLKTQQSAVQKLKADLAGIDRRALESGVRIIRRARSEFEGGHLAAARKSVEQLADTWPQFEGLGRLRSRIESAAEAHKAASERQAESIKEDRSSSAVDAR